MPENGNDNNLKNLAPLRACDRCKNAFFAESHVEGQELVCDNCLKLEKRKNELELGVLENVIESNKQMETCIMQMKNNLTTDKEKNSAIEKKPLSKQDYLNSIKKRAKTLTKSIDLLEKIDETQDEEYIDEYKTLFERMKEGE